MARRRPLAASPDDAFLLRQAAKRVHPGIDLNGKLWLKYGADIDMLTIRLTEHPRPTHSDDDLDQGVIYNYEGKNLISIEITDISQ